jgi:hypothetical protein
LHLSVILLACVFRPISTAVILLACVFRPISPSVILLACVLRPITLPACSFSPPPPRTPQLHFVPLWLLSCPCGCKEGPRSFVCLSGGEQAARRPPKPRACRRLSWSGWPLRSARAPGQTDTRGRPGRSSCYRSRSMRARRASGRRCRLQGNLNSLTDRPHQKRGASGLTRGPVGRRAHVLGPPV